MKITKEFAEILGMFAADGCLQHPHYICMWGNIYEDQEYYDKVVCPLFSKVFNKEITAHEKKSNSVYGFYICNKEIVKIFKELEFSNKKTYNVKVPKEILESENEEVIAGFIRGFTDCDGCLTFMRRKEKGYSKFKQKFHTYPRIFIFKPLCIPRWRCFLSPPVCELYPRPRIPILSPEDNLLPIPTSTLKRSR